MPVLAQMIGILKSLYMKIRAPIIPATEMDGKETVVESVVHRRVEVMVVRESVSILVPGQSANDEEGGARKKSRPKAACKELPSPEQTHDSQTVVPAPKDR